MSTFQQLQDELMRSQPQKFSLPGENYTLCYAYCNDGSTIVESPFIPIAMFSIADTQFTTSINGTALSGNDLRIVLELMPSVDIAVQSFIQYNLQSFVLPAGQYVDTSKPDVLGERVILLYLIEN